MWIAKCLLLAVASIVVAWDPVRPGALVRDIGKLLIVDESVRLILNFANVSHVEESIADIEKGMTLVETRLCDVNTNETDDEIWDGNRQS